jgi:predicted nucleotidyltransferase
VASIALFGSYVRHEERPGSDLDVLVAFDQAPGLLEFVELENYLSDALGVKVDLVMQESLKPRIGKRILSEAVPV